MLHRLRFGRSGSAHGHAHGSARLDTVETPMPAPCSCCPYCSPTRPPPRARQARTPHAIWYKRVSGLMTMRGRRTARTEALQHTRQVTVTHREHLDAVSAHALRVPRVALTLCCEADQHVAGIGITRQLVRCVMCLATGQHGNLLVGPLRRS